MNIPLTPWRRPWLMAVLAVAAAPGLASAQLLEAVYASVEVDPMMPTETLLFLSDGNVNGLVTDPTVTDGYLDGHDLAVFDWNDAQSSGCATGVTSCADISTSDGFSSAAGLTRPHWGVTTDGKDAATVYWLLRDASRNYFDAYNTLTVDIRDVPNSDELVVMINRPTSTNCSGSCMRPWRSTADMNNDYRIFRTTRPDGVSNGGWDYDQRPKIFLRAGHWDTARIPVHELGHYYNRTVVENNGLGGGFYRQGSYEEKATDEGLGYWYVSDYADTLYWGRWSSPGIPTYNAIHDPTGDVHDLGDVITGAFWRVRDETSCSQVGWSTAVFSQVDTIKGADFGIYDPFGQGSIMRGFAWRVLKEAYDSGACSKTAIREAVRIFQEHELIPPFLDQAAGGSTNEAGDRFGSTVTTGDFDGDGYDDLAVGSPFETQAGAVESGFVHVFFGHFDGMLENGFSESERIDQTTTGGALESGDRYGGALASGDFDNDGYDDLVVGAPGEDVGSATDAGQVHVLYGSAMGVNPPANQDNITQSFFGSTNEVGDRFGSALTVGDFDGDGYDDLAIGAPGETLGSADETGYVFIAFGSSTGLSSSGIQKFSQTSLGSTNEDGDHFAKSLAAGDLDGDGYDDLAIGAPDEDQMSANDSGFLFVVYGSTSGVQTSSVQRINQESISSVSEVGDGFATSLTMGDFDDDGHDDLAIGAPREDQMSTTDSGFLFVLYGHSGRKITSSWQKFNQESAGSTSEADDRYASTLAAGDYDGDGKADLAIGLPGEDLSGAVDTGYVHIYHGSAGGLSTSGAVRFSQSSLMEVNETGDELAASLASGDFDGDGTFGLAIGAPGQDLAGAEAGAVFLYGD